MEFSANLTLMTQFYCSQTIVSFTCNLINVAYHKTDLHE